jgi:hypothetical protein
MLYYCTRRDAKDHQPTLAHCIDRYDVNMWIGFSWLSMGPMTGKCEQGSELSSDCTRSIVRTHRGYVKCRICGCLWRFVRTEMWCWTSSVSYGHWFADTILTASPYLHYYCYYSSSSSSCSSSSVSNNNNNNVTRCNLLLTITSRQIALNPFVCWAPFVTWHLAGVGVRKFSLSFTKLLLK